MCSVQTDWGFFRRLDECGDEPLDDEWLRLLGCDGGGATARGTKVGSQTNFADDCWILRRSKEEKHFLLKHD